MLLEVLLLASSFGEALSGGASESKGVRQTSARACSTRFCWCAASRVVPNEQRERPATLHRRAVMILDTSCMPIRMLLMYVSHMHLAHAYAYVWEEVQPPTSSYPARLGPAPRARHKRR